MWGLLSGTLASHFQLKYHRTRILARYKTVLNQSYPTTFAH